MENLIFGLWGQGEIGEREGALLDAYETTTNIEVARKLNERQKCFSHDIIFVQTSDISIIKGQVTIILGIIDTLKPTSQLMVKMQSFKAKVTF